MFSLLKKNLLVRSNDDIEPLENGTKDIFPSKESIEKLLKRYPDRVPVIVKPIDDKQPEIDKQKYLVPKDMFLSQFIYIIKMRLKNFKSDEALFLFIDNNIPRNTETMIELYERYKIEGYLNIKYGIENTFG